MNKTPTSNTASSEETLSHEQRLKAMVYQLIKLYDRWSEDRLQSLANDADMKQQLNDFSEQVKHFKQLEQSVRHQIRDSIHTASTVSLEDSAKKIDDTIKQSLEEALAKLRHSIEHTEQKLAQFRREFQSSFLYATGLCVLTAVLVSALMIWFWFPVNAIQLTKHQMDGLYLGSKLQAAWPDMSEKDKDYLLKLLDTAKKTQP